MATPASVRFDPSILDRLENPTNYKGHKQTLVELKETLARDLENLLNTKRDVSSEWLKQYSELEDSILMYGITDFYSFRNGAENGTTFHSSSDAMHDHAYFAAIERGVVDAIRTFEPRLVNAFVEFVERADLGLHVQITAELHVGTEQDDANFDIVLQLSTKEYLVKSSNGR